jgi:indole-3-glycerol phosphate synthase
VIQPDFDPVRIARNYKEGGAHCLSVLTDVDFFQGSLDYIPLVRGIVDLPVLRKDFIIDSLQIEEAHAVGADAVLLIAAILDTSQLREYRLFAESLGMDVLVEIHDERELDSALEAESRLIGIATVTDMRRLKEAGVAAALIGESLMRAGQQDQLLREFLTP